MNISSRLPAWYSVVVVILMVAVACGPATGANANVGTSSFPFLKINVGARAIGMGGAFTGLADDEASVYYNPAGITSVLTNRYMLEYHNYFVDMQSGVVGLVHPMSGSKFMALHLNYLNYGDFTQTNLAGDVTGTFSGGDLVLAGTLAMKYREAYAFGATAKLIYEKVQSFSATGVAVDLGAKWTANRGRYSAGVMIQNLGVQLSGLGDDKDKLPMMFRAGGAAKPRGLNTIFSGDVLVPVDNDPAVAIGAEYLRLKPIYLRLGYNSFGTNYRAQNSDDNWAGLSLGVGFDVKRMQISYAYTPAADLGESHRITLTGGL
ncbi:MAG: PorV/PorQ family protein [Candidatus Zixiibacteriota bacterium]